MNIIFSSQGSFSRLMLALGKIHKRKYPECKIGLLISDYEFHRELLEHFESSIFDVVLKEWEVLRDAEDLGPADTSEPGITTAWLADRRLSHGPLCKYVEDRVCRHSHERIQKTLSRGAHSVNEFVEKIRPHVIFGSIPVTFLEKQLFELAANKGIPDLVIRTVKIGNLQGISSLSRGRLWPDCFGTSNWRGAVSNDERNAIDAVKNKLCAEVHKYEGVHEKTPSISRAQCLIYFLKMAFYYIQQIFIKSSRPYDYHAITKFRFNYSQVIRFFRERRKERVVKRLDRLVVDPNSVGRYFFFPLHAEPEVSTSIFGRPFVKTQAALIEYASLCLPLDCKLVIKEHPRDFGYRSGASIEQLLSSPNVLIAQASSPTGGWIKKAECVMTISGAAALESVANNRPLILFGDHDIEILGEPFVHPCSELKELPAIINKIRHLDSETYRVGAMLDDYILYFLRSAVSLNLYTDILQKDGRVSLDSPDLHLGIEALHENIEINAQRCKEAIERVRHV